MLRCRLTMDDLARWELWGIPSAWRSPTTRCPGGNALPNHRPSVPSLPPGQRVVALGEADGMLHPQSPVPVPGLAGVSAIPAADSRGAGRRAPA